jgi:RNA polymerase sigma-70 factor, ECF subfamily
MNPFGRSQAQSKIEDASISVDDRLALAAQQGDLDAFNRLVESYEQRVYNLALRMLGNSEAAADATQDAFFQAYKAINQYRGGSFKSWLLRIASNICYDRLRSNKRKPSVSLDEMQETAEETGGSLLAILEDPNADPQSHAARHELMRELNHALNQLPEQQRLIVVLADVQGLNYEEIAEIAGCSLGTVKSRLSRGRTKLREYLQPIVDNL